MCEYCEKEKSILHDSDYESVNVFVTNGLLWEKTADMGTEINYCPMCGKKIGDQMKEQGISTEEYIKNTKKFVDSLPKVEDIVNKISQEEAIKILRDIPFYEQEENHDVNGPKYFLKTNKRLAKARDMVLDLYLKEKQRNIELLNSKTGIDLSYDDYISKDKIRAKIEYLKHRREKYPEYSYAILYAVDRLKELLEEE